MMLELKDGGLDTTTLYSKWLKEAKDAKCGAYMSFTGIVRDDGGIDGLSFDIYRPLLQSWYDNEVIKAKREGVYLAMAHSIGDVFIGESSYIAFAYSKHRVATIKYIAEFVESFKHSATIWKYDLINGKRVYAKERSYKIEGSGILS